MDEKAEVALALAMSNLSAVYLGILGASGYYVTPEGLVVSTYAGKVRALRPGRSGQMGYKAVQLGASGRRDYVHRLMAETFLGPPDDPGQRYVRHLDGNLDNNHISNLAWGTAHENMADMKRHGRIACGQRNGMARLTSEIVAAVRVRLSTAKTQREVATEFGISVMQMSRIARGIAWQGVE